MRKPKEHSYYVIGFANELANSGMILDCFMSTGDGKYGFERAKQDMALSAAAGKKHNGYDLPKNGFKAIRLVKAIA